MVYPVSSNNGIASGLLVLSSFCKLNRNQVPAPPGGSGNGRKNRHADHPGPMLDTIKGEQDV
jgi:hypothetical protein